MPFWRRAPITCVELTLHISNHREIIRRLGVIAMNGRIETDICELVWPVCEFGHVAAVSWGACPP